MIALALVSLDLLHPLAEEDHSVAAGTPPTSRRYGRYLATEHLGRPRLDAASEGQGGGEIRWTINACR